MDTHKKCPFCGWEGDCEGDECPQCHLDMTSDFGEDVITSEDNVEDWLNGNES